MTQSSPTKKSGRSTKVLRLLFIAAFLLGGHYLLEYKAPYEETVEWLNQERPTMGYREGTLFLYLMVYQTSFFAGLALVGMVLFAAIRQYFFQPKTKTES